MNRFMLRQAWHLANRVFFGLRGRLRWQRPGYREVPESKEGLFADLSLPLAEQARERERELREGYHLQELYGAATRLNYQENLFLLDLLDRVGPASGVFIPEEPRILDVGAKNWYYVRALYRFFQYHGHREPRNIHLTGIELDAYRVYADWRSRYDYAQYFKQGLANCRYLVGDFLDHEDRYDIVLLLFPFVLERTVLEWGLPLEYFQPLAFLRHALERIEPPGTVLIVNQGEEEAKVQLELLLEIGYRHRFHGRFESLFMTYREPRFVTIVAPSP